MRGAALALLLLGTSQWCAAGLFSDDEAHKKIADLQQQVQQQMQTLETRLAATENLARTQTKGLLELVSQIDALKAELSKLQGQNEVYAHDIETTQKRQRDLYADLDGRLRKLERSGTQTEADKPTGGGEPLVAATPPVQLSQPAQVAASPGDESKAYETALNQFKVGNYQGAITGFQGFVNSHPNSTLTPSALYWIGNSYFNLRDYKNAIASQQKLISQFTSSPKVPDAMLNLASCQQGLGDAGSARKTLEELVAKYPISNAADLAKKRLANLK